MEVFIDVWYWHTWMTDLFLLLFEFKRVDIIKLRHIGEQQRIVTKCCLTGYSLFLQPFHMAGNTSSLEQDHSHNGAEAAGGTWRGLL